MSTQAKKITRAINRIRNNPKLGNVDPATMDVSFDEHFQYQQIQSQAHAAGKIPADAASIIYIALGEVGSAANGGWAADTDLATKFVVSQAVAELLTMRLDGQL